MTQKFQNKQFVIVRQVRDNKESHFINKVGTVYSYNEATSIYLVQLEEGRLPSAFYEDELEDVQTEFSEATSASGRKRLEFYTMYGELCELKQTSQNHHILLGIKEVHDNEGRMSLSQEQVKYLLPHLTKFAETGELFS